MRKGMPTAVVNQMKSIEADPFDKEKQFALIDSLIEDAKLQMINLMSDNNIKMPLWGSMTFNTGTDLAWSSGGILGQDMIVKSKGTGLISANVESQPGRPSSKGRPRHSRHEGRPSAGHQVARASCRTARDRTDRRNKT